MKMFLGGLATLLMAYSVVVADETETIPLDQIWGYNLPGTKDVQDIEAPREPGRGRLMDDSPLVVDILRALHRIPEPGEKAGPAFAVTGVDHEALSNARDALTAQSEPSATVPPGDVSLVFYSHLCGKYVWIDSIERSENIITITYRFFSHSTNDATTHFALIPLGKLSAGKYQVKIKQGTPGSVHGARRSPVLEPHRFVCRESFFQVEGERGRK